MKTAEAQGKFHYTPGLETQTNNSYEGLEKEEKILLSSHISSSIPAATFPSSSLPPPLVPTASAPAPVQRVPPQQQQNHIESAADEFLDPELDLELDGINLDGDPGVSLLQLS